MGRLKNIEVGKEQRKITKVGKMDKQLLVLPFSQKQNHH